MQAELAKRKNASKIDFQNTGFKKADDIIDTNLDTMLGGNNFQVINTSADSAVVDELYAAAWQTFKDSVFGEMKRQRDVARVEMDAALAALYILPVVHFNPTQAQQEAFELSKLKLNEAQAAAEIAAKAAKDAADAAALDAAKAAEALAAQIAADKAAADAKQAALTATTTTQTSSLSFVKSDPDPNIGINLDPTPSVIGVTTDGFSFDFSKITFPDFNFNFNFDFDFDLDVPVLPKDVKKFDEKGKTSAVVTFRTPAPAYSDGTPIPVTLVSSPTAGLVSGSGFPIGVTTMTFFAGDDEEDSASFTITILDGERPIITSFPDPINVVVASSETSAIVTWTEPVATDNTPGVGITQTTLFPSGSSFPIGSTTVTYKAVDASLNQSTQNFEVTVSNGATGTVAFVVNTP